jgi:hypothetical protein
VRACYQAQKGFAGGADQQRRVAQRPPQRRPQPRQPGDELQVAVARLGEAQPCSEGIKGSESQPRPSSHPNPLPAACATAQCPLPTPAAPRPSELTGPYGCPTPPGSSTMRHGSMPAASAASACACSSAPTSVATSPYAVFSGLVMVPGSPRMCIIAYGTPNAATCVASTDGKRRVTRRGQG